MFQCSTLQACPKTSSSLNRLACTDLNDYCPCIDSLHSRGVDKPIFFDIIVTQFDIKKMGVPRRAILNRKNFCRAGWFVVQASLDHFRKAQMFLAARVMSLLRAILSKLCILPHVRHVTRAHRRPHQRSKVRKAGVVCVRVCVCGCVLCCR